MVSKNFYALHLNIYGQANAECNPSLHSFCFIHKLLQPGTFLYPVEICSQSPVLSTPPPPRIITDLSSALGGLVSTANVVISFRQKAPFSLISVKLYLRTLVYPRHFGWRMQSRKNVYFTFFMNFSELTFHSPEWFLEGVKIRLFGDPGCKFHSVSLPLVTALLSS